MEIIFCYNRSKLPGKEVTIPCTFDDSCKEGQPIKLKNPLWFYVLLLKKFFKRFCYWPSHCELLSCLPFSLFYTFYYSSKNAGWRNTPNQAKRRNIKVCITILKFIIYLPNVSIIYQECWLVVGTIWVGLRVSPAPNIW